MKPGYSGAHEIAELHRRADRGPDPGRGHAARLAPARADAGRPAARVALAGQRGAAPAGRQGPGGAHAEPRLFRGAGCAGRAVAVIGQHAGSGARGLLPNRRRPAGRRAAGCRHRIAAAPALRPDGQPAERRAGPHRRRRLDRAAARLRLGILGHDAYARCAAAILPAAAGAGAGGAAGTRLPARPRRAGALPPGRKAPAGRRHRDRQRGPAARSRRALSRIAGRSVGQRLLHRRHPPREPRAPAAFVPLDARPQALPRTLRAAPAHPRPAGTRTQPGSLGRHARAPVEHAAQHRPDHPLLRSPDAGHPNARP